MLTHHLLCGVKLQNNTSADCSLFLHLNPLWIKTLEFQSAEEPYINCTKCINVFNRDAISVATLILVFHYFL